MRALDTIHRNAEARASGRNLAGAQRAAKLMRLRDRAIYFAGGAGRYAAARSPRSTASIFIIDPEGLQIELPFSKTNQSGEEEYVLISRGSNRDYCGARAIEAWLAAANLNVGAVFRREGSRGLYLIHALSPNVTVVSQPDGGSEIRVTLPIRLVQE